AVWQGALLTQTLKAFAFVVALLGYAKWEEPSLVEFRFGVIVTAIMMLLIASPLFSLLVQFQHAINLCWDRGLNPGPSAKKSDTCTPRSPGHQHAIKYTSEGICLFSPSGEVIRTKSTAMLPFPLILSGTVVTFLWLLYGIIINNSLIQLQNVVGLTLCAIQLSLFVIYPSKPKAAKKKQ
ncbi:unnamed protein product, partial [Timema podura]|nr:unnamed protein product [Timema podura]